MQLLLCSSSQLLATPTSCPGPALPRYGFRPLAARATYSSSLSHSLVGNGFFLHGDQLLPLHFPPSLGLDSPAHTFPWGPRQSARARDTRPSSTVMGRAGVPRFSLIRLWCARPVRIL